MSLNQFETDEQRAEALVSWLRDNSAFLILLVLVCIGVFFGTHYYKKQKEQAIILGADTYGQFFQKMQHENKKLTEDDLTAISALDKTIYQSLASSAIAQQYVSDEKLSEAENVLQSALEREKDTVLQDLIRLRIANLQYNQTEYDKALLTLNNITLGSYESLVQTLRGDIYVKQGKKDQAKIAYTEVMKDENRSELTQYKLNMLGDLSNQAE